MLPDSLPVNAHTISPCRSTLTCISFSTQGAESRFEFTAPDELVPWTITSVASKNARPAAENISAGPCRQEGSVSSEGVAAVGRDSSREAVGTGEGEALLRYCHLYSRGELTELCTEISGVEVVEEYWDCSNCCIILQRV